jgi:hypothetical protein
MEFCTLQIIMKGRRHKEARGHLRRLRMRLTLTALLLAVSFPGYAQEGYAGHGHDMWHHGFYNTLQRPDAKGSCCNLSDCRPTSGRMLDGHYEVKVDGAWISVPQTKIIRKSAPDSGYHVCAPQNFRGQPEELYCVILAPEG